MLMRQLQHAWCRPAATAHMRGCSGPRISPCGGVPAARNAKTIQQCRGASGSSSGAKELGWTQRKVSPLEVAAGIGADAQRAAQRLRATAERFTETAQLAEEGAGLEAVDTSDGHASGASQSSAAASDGTASDWQQDKHRRQSEVAIGAFQRIPQVQVASEQLTSALRKAQRLGGSKTIKNEAAKARTKAAKQLDAAMKYMSTPLTGYMKAFPPSGRLHPFERALLDLTIGEASYATTLARIDTLRKKLIEVGKQYAARGARASSKKEALATADEGFETLERIFNGGAPAVDQLVYTARALRRLPLVDPFLPTVALVGAPNVGKSSLVALLSSGAPEVCDYPFTTRSIKMGHFYVNGQRHQVTDTPGLLRRPEDERNAMERLTLAALAHLPTAAVFVTDLTGECGTSVPDQWAIRQHLRARFPGKLWLDVLSKADLLEEELEAADQLYAAGANRLQDSEEVPAQDGPAQAASAADTDTQSSPATAPEAAAAVVSGVDASDPAENEEVTNGAAVAPAARKLRPRVYRWGLGSGSGDVDGSRIAGGAGPIDAVQVAAALPHALRASATRGDGLDDLKAAVMQLLSEQAFAQQLATGYGPSDPLEEEKDEPAPRGPTLDRGLLTNPAPQGAAAS